MARILLDTHALMWYDSDPDRLNVRVHNALRSPDAKIFVSAASVYELAYKVETKRMPLIEGLVLQFEARLKVYEFEVIPITSSHALLAAKLEWKNRDPFDRIIVAQAIKEKCVIVTKDRLFESAPNVKTIW